MVEQPKILLVDDKTENLLALGRSLEEMDVEIICASSGNEALSAVLDHDFALVLMDVQMPEMDGFETVRLIRSNRQTENLPVIFVSAIYSDEIYHVTGIESGAVDFLEKPMNLTILRGKVSVFLKLYNQRRELEKALEKVKTLQRLLPICSFCKNIRNDDGSWSELEVYFQNHSNAEFTHSICPDCAKKHYPGVYKNQK